MNGTVDGMNEKERERFDRLLEEVLDALPPALLDLLESAPLIVEDEPSAALMKELAIDPDEDVLAGLHTGTPLTERSVAQESDIPETIHLFRRGIVGIAEGWAPGFDAHGVRRSGEERIKEQIRITLLHEIGHHFGLEETDLEELGYG